jgi:hypothetical protein
MDSSTLWQQIIAAPGDENLKGQFVQALVQAGDPRAEIFRLAAELKRFPAHYVQHDPLAQQYATSLEVWQADFASAARKWRAGVNFIQGWPIEITIAAGDFCRNAAEIVAALPLRHLNLKAVQEAPEVFAVAPMGQIVSVESRRQPWPREAIHSLARSQQLHALQWLDLSETGITEVDVEILAASPALKDLAYLDLRNNPCRDPVDAAEGYGFDGITGMIVSESIWLPRFGRELEARYGPISWLHSLERFRERHPPDRYTL